jgi:hypothetical protein
VAAHPGLKATGLKLWTEAAAAGVTQHSHWSMKDRYCKARPALRCVRCVRRALSWRGGVR